MDLKLLKKPTLFCDIYQLTIIWMSIIRLNTGCRLQHSLENFTFHNGFPLVRTDGRSVTRLPKFLGRTDYQIFLGVGLRALVEIRYD